MMMQPIENNSRVFVTMRLLMGNHNESNNDLIKNANYYWQLMTTPVDEV
jgi:hypothetical protein